LDFDGSWDEVVGFSLMGSAALFGFAALLAAGPSAVAGWMRGHPLLVALTTAFILLSIAAALATPPE
jgi:hypothetical protein